jgi:CHAD domain-containing protein
MMRSAMTSPTVTRLRLVPQAVAELGPISPELALVCPELADAAREAEGDHTGVLLDTPDLLLRELGITLERRRDGDSSSWTLTLPRGEIVARTGEDGDDPPEQIADLLRAVIDGRDLLPIPWHVDDADIARLQAQMWAQRRELLRHDPGSRLGEDPENLHQLRVASRRLRAFLRVGRRVFDPAWEADVRTGLRQLAGASGPVRDLDVLIDRLRAEVSDLDPGEREAGEALLAELESERRELQRALVDVLGDRAYLLLLERLALPMRVADQPVRISLRKRAARELRRLVAEVERLGDSPADDALHALRIRVKRVRYAAELAGRRSRRAGRVVDAARRLQDVLGDHQDAAVAEERLRRLVERNVSTSAAFVAGRLAERQRRKRDELKRELPAAWRRLRRATRRFR